MNVEQVEYILEYYSNLMNNNEALAWKNWSMEYKTLHVKSSKEQIIKRLDILRKLGWISDNPDVLKLLENGIESFRINTTKRILRDNPNRTKNEQLPKM